MTSMRLPNSSFIVSFVLCILSIPVASGAEEQNRAPLVRVQGGTSRVPDARGRVQDCRAPKNADGYLDLQERLAYPEVGAMHWVPFV